MQSKADKSESTDLSTEKLAEIPGGWSSRDVSIGGRSFCLTVPADPDAFLDDPAVHAAHERDAFMPYWPYLWPAAYDMAEAVTKADWNPETPALELGSGIGLVGLAALSAGLQVTFSDYAADAVRLALHNARRNGYPAAEGLLLDWRDPPHRQFSVILGCDILYEQVNHEPILNLLAAMLTVDGVCWLADGGRRQGGLFFELARQRGFEVALFDASGQKCRQPLVGSNQLMQLRCH